MPTVTVRNLDEDTKLALQELGAAHGRSMEAEARAILSEAVRRERSVAHFPDQSSPGLGERIHQRFVDLNLGGDLIIELVDRDSEADRLAFDPRETATEDRGQR